MGVGICLFRRVGNGILNTGTGIHETKTIEKWERDFNLSNTGWVCGILAGISLYMHKSHNTRPLLPLKILHNHCLQFLLGQRNLKTMYMQILGGIKEVNYGICAGREFGKKQFAGKLGPPPHPPPSPSFGTL